MKSIPDMNDQVLCLKLDKLSLQDAGLIKVVARNFLGEANISSLVAVKGNIDVTYYSFMHRISISVG